MLAQHTRTIVISFGILVLLGVLTAGAQEFFPGFLSGSRGRAEWKLSPGEIVELKRDGVLDSNDPETVKTEQLLLEGKISPSDLATMKAQTQRRREWENLPESEKLRLKEEARQQHLQEEEVRKKLPSESPWVPPVGILDQIDPVFPGSVFRQTPRAWRGYANEKLVTIVTGSFYADPGQGIVVVMEGVFDPTQFKTYKTPSATGPVKIVAESNGILILESITGTFEVYREETNTRENVITPGKSVYHFNTTTRKFQ